jgi:hypothetical protein
MTLFHSPRGVPHGSRALGAQRAFPVECRNKAGLPQVDFAKRLRWPRSCLTHVEAGQKHADFVELMGSRNAPWIAGSSPIPRSDDQLISLDPELRAGAVEVAFGEEGVEQRFRGGPRA